MITGFFKVVSCGNLTYVHSDKADNGQLAKRNIILQEMGGRFADQYLGTLLGNDANCQFYTGDMVIASLRFATRNYNGQAYQDIVVADICKLAK